jgi:hypothetical protein
MTRTVKAKYRLAASIAFLTFLIYLPALQNDFVNWDDPEYVIENPYIRSLNVKADFIRRCDKPGFVIKVSIRKKFSWKCQQDA